MLNNAQLIHTTVCGIQMMRTPRDRLMTYLSDDWIQCKGYARIIMIDQDDNILGESNDNQWIRNQKRSTINKRNPNITVEPASARC